MIITLVDFRCPLSSDRTDFVHIAVFDKLNLYFTQSNVNTMYIRLEIMNKCALVLYLKSSRPSRALLTEDGSCDQILECRSCQLFHCSQFTTYRGG